MKKVGFVLAATAVSSVLLVSIGCTSKVTEVTSALEDAATNLPSSSSGSSGHHTTSSSSGGSTSSSGGSSTSSSGGSSTSSSGGSTSSSGGSTSSSGGSTSSSSSSSSSSSGGPGTCPSTTPIAIASLPWAPPIAPQAGKCTEAELTAFDAKIPTAASDADMKSAVSATCAACIFNDATSATWAPIPEDRSGADPQILTINVGGCYATMTGSTACGKAMQNRFDCTFSACGGCADNASFQTCLGDASIAMNACHDEATAVTAACGGIDMTTLTNADNACQPATAKYVFDGAVRVACIAKP